MSAVAADRILIVEDDERIGSTLLRALEGNGYDAQWVQRGDAAVEAATLARPDLVLLDLGLPDIDGLEVCRQLKADPSLRHIPVIFLTASNQMFHLVEIGRAHV